MFELLRRKLSKAQSQMKETTDKQCRDQEFEVGDWVLVKLIPHRQTSATGSAYSKFAKRYYGPFQVMVCMGKVAYKLLLPDHSRIHPIFHSSLLKPYVASTDPRDIADLPPMAVDNHPVITPLAILASKIIPSETGPKRMVLVQWEGLAPEDTSWEEWSEFNSLHHLEDKVLFDGQGNVTKNIGGVPLAREQQGTSNSEGVSLARPRRKKVVPTYLDDYVRTCSHASYDYTKCMISCIF